MSRSLRDSKPRGYPVREIEGQGGQYESYFRTLPIAPVSDKSCLSKRETIVVNAYIETDKDGYLLNNLIEVLSTKRSWKAMQHANKRSRLVEELRFAAEEDRAAEAAAKRQMVEEALVKKRLEMEEASMHFSH